MERVLSLIFLTLMFLSIYCNVEDIIPIPKSVSKGSQFYYVNKCNLKFTVLANPKIKKEINELYQFYFDKMFSKYYICKSKDKVTENLKENITFLFVQIDNKVDYLLSDDFNTNIENYNLSIRENSIIIQSSSYSGFVRGLETLSQIIEGNTDGNQMYVIRETPITIIDYPSYKVRGLMIDLSRHYHSIDKLYTIINGMMFTKLNTLILHLSDDDSYQMDSIIFPDLTNYTGFEENQSYRVPVMQNLIYFAKTRGIHIIPEFDNPAHITSLGNYRTYSDVYTCFNNFTNVSNPGGIDIIIKGGPSNGMLDPSMWRTYYLIDSIIGDLFEIFNNTRYIHLGGDDVNYECWDTSPSIKEYMKNQGISNYDDLLSLYFSNIRVNFSKRNNSKIPIYWNNEGIFNVKYQKGDILNFWGHSTNISVFLNQFPDNPVILSPHDYFYFDCGFGGPIGEIGSWCDPVKTWVWIYGFNFSQYQDPNKRILGFIAPVWSELINEDSLILKIFPRGTSLGELLWSNITSVTDLSSISQRIIRQSKKMKAWGVEVSPVTLQHCEDYSYECFQKYFPPPPMVTS